MGLEEEGRRRLEQAEARPHTREAWLPLATWAARGGRLVPRPELAELVSPLVELLKAAPADPALLPALLALLDLELPDPAPGPAGYFERTRRARGGPGGWLDKELGLPLAVRRRRDGGLMRLVIQSSVRIETGWRQVPLPRRSLVCPVLYMDESPVTNAQVAGAVASLPGWVVRLVEAQARRVGPEAAADLPRPAAAAFARAHGMRLPEDHELRRVYTRPEVLATRPGQVPHLDKEERRAAQAPWDAANARFAALASLFAIELDEAKGAEPEWTATPYARYLEWMEPGEGWRGQAGRHLARSLERVELPGDEEHRRFRLAVPLWSPI